MGHGIVKPNLDGSKEKCGGPTTCLECAGEFLKEYAEDAIEPFTLPDENSSNFINWFMDEYPYMINDHERNTTYRLCKKVWEAALKSKDFKYVVQ